MPRFVELDDGTFLNLDLVARARGVGREDGVALVALFDARGDRLGDLETYSDVDFNTYVAPIVPAAPGAVAIRVWVDVDAEERPTQGDICEDRATIVAWCIRFRFPRGATAIFVDGFGDEKMVLIEAPDGGVFWQADGQRFAGIEEAKAWLLGWRQREWDDGHGV